MRLFSMKQFSMGLWSSTQRATTWSFSYKAELPPSRRNASFIWLPSRPWKLSRALRLKAWLNFHWITRIFWLFIQLDMFVNENSLSLPLSSSSSSPTHSNKRDTFCQRAPHLLPLNKKNLQTSPNNAIQTSQAINLNRNDEKIPMHVI